MKDIQLALSDALQYITEATVDEPIKDSVASRLRLRINFLSALERGLEAAEDRTSEEWLSCIRILPSLTDTNSLGKPVEESFSLKIQRRLASSVPPRPMVKISFEDAMAHLKRLCKDAIDVLQVLDFHGSNNLLVSPFSFLEHAVVSLRSGLVLFTLSSFEVVRDMAVITHLCLPPPVTLTPDASPSQGSF